MARKISEMSVGVIYLDETVDGVLSHVPYWNLGADSSGNYILLRECTTMTKRMNATNVAVYDGCEMDLYLENEESGFLSRFDAATRACFVSTQIKCNNISTGEIAVIARRCFLLSCTELGYATTPDEGSSYLTALQSITGKTGNNARIAYNEALTAVSWWMRSAYSESQFRCVVSSGYAGSLSASNASYWLRPALSVSPDTLVSDETEETIYLLPDASKTYRSINATISMGASEKRPKKMRPIVTIENCTESTIEVSNNAKDTDPVWVTATNNEEVETPNTTKETDNWEIGVRITAKSGGKGIVHEPIILVETEES
ncbi:MAG: DUF6273 domain-containing protein [Dorea sp.]